MAAHSYDAGERLTITRDAQGAFHVDHGATRIATVKRAMGGAVRVEAAGRSWRLTPDDDGWTAAGEPQAALRHRVLRSDRLTVGTTECTIRGHSVDAAGQPLLRFARRVDDRSRKSLVATIAAPPPTDADAHALIALATTAVLLGADLEPTGYSEGLNGDNVSAALRYGTGI